MDSLSESKTITAPNLSQILTLEKALETLHHNDLLLQKKRVLLSQVKSANLKTAEQEMFQQ